MPTKDDPHYLRELLDMHREEALGAHRRLRVDLIERSARCDTYEDATNLRLRELEKEMDRLIHDQRTQTALSAQKAVLLGSIGPAVIAALVTLIIHFWK